MASKEISATGMPQDSSTGASHRYSRIVIKAGSALLTSGGETLDQRVMESLVHQLAELRTQGVEVILVTSGAVAAGRRALGLDREGNTLPLRQVMAAVGMGKLLHSYEQLFQQHGIPVAQALLTRHDLENRSGYLNVRNTLLKLMELAVIPIINENDVVAVDELGGRVFGDNDTLSALVANLIDADLLVLLGRVEGLYTADPTVAENARLIPKVERVDKDIETVAGSSRDGLGRGGMATKLEAAKLAMSSGTTVVIAGGHQSNVLIKLTRGESVGTMFVPAAERKESRKRWLMSGASENKGEMVVDEGAADALTRKGSSLLPAGIVEVNGSFKRGDVVAVVGADGIRLAIGMTNYGSEEVTAIKGVHSRRIAELLGHNYGDEAIHRNNMLVL